MSSHPALDLDIEDSEFVVCRPFRLWQVHLAASDRQRGCDLGTGRLHEDATAIPPHGAALPCVQSYALYPHMSVRKNIAFPLRMAGLDKAEQARRVEEAARVLNLTEYLDRRPGQLSGGQRQRVAIGRAIVREPTAFLFDEPLSNLDAALRVGMRLEISELHKRLATTMIYVTHDQVEAMTMADKIVVLQNGVIEQVGSPLDPYRNPEPVYCRVHRLADEPVAGGRSCRAQGAYHRHPAGAYLDLRQVRPRRCCGLSEHLGSDTFFHITCPAFAEPDCAQAEVDCHMAATST